MALSPESVAETLQGLATTLLDRHAMGPLLDALLADTQFPIDGLWQREFVSAAEFLQSPSACSSQRLPLGRVVCVLPGNGPIYTLAKVLAPALWGGNQVTFKLPSRLSRSYPILRQLLGDLVPRVSLVYLDGVEREGFVETTLADPDVAALVLFGSAAWARRLSRSARQSSARILFEGPGNDPAVVLPGADLQHAAACILEGAFYNGGQSCSAIKRVYVHRDLREGLLAALLDRVESFSAGDPAQSGVHIGPCVSDALRQRVQRHMEQVREYGVFHQGDGQLNPQGLLQPTVVEVPAHLPVVTEETFYPVVPVVGVSDEDEARWLIDAGDYGLNASVFGQYSERFLAFLWATHKGVAVDGLVTHPPNRGQLRLVGGFRDSGFVAHWVAGERTHTPDDGMQTLPWSVDQHFLLRHGRFHLEWELTRPA